MFSLSKDIQILLSEVFKFRMVTIFSLNFRYIVTLCVFLSCIKTTRSRLRFHITFVLKFRLVLYFISYDVQFDRLNQN